MGDDSKGRTLVLGVSLAVVVAGLLWGLPEVGVELGLTAWISSMGPVGSDAAGAFASSVDAPAAGAELATFSGEYAPQLANIHPALPYLITLLGLAGAGEGMRRRRR